MTNTNTNILGLTKKGKYKYVGFGKKGQMEIQVYWGWKKGRIQILNKYLSHTNTNALWQFHWHCLEVQESFHSRQHTWSCQAILWGPVWRDDGLAWQSLSLSKTCWSTTGCTPGGSVVLQPAHPWGHRPGCRTANLQWAVPFLILWLKLGWNIELS